MEVQVEHGDLQLTFTGEGTTSDEDITQELDLDVDSLDFVIEEVYVTAGDVVETGAPLYKLTEESIAKAIAYYEEQVTDAKEDVEDAQSSYDAGVAQAEYDKEAAQSTASSAKEVYDAANSSLDQEVTDAKAALDEANCQISTYQSNLDADTYYSDAGVADKKKAFNKAEKAEAKAKQAYEEAQKSYNEAYTAIQNGIIELEQTASNTQELSTEKLVEKIHTLNSNNQTLTEKKTVLNEAEKTYTSAKNEKEKAQQEYQTATMNYEKVVSEAKAKKETLENTISSLERAYASAVNAATTGKTDNQNTYETAVLEGQYADTVYSSAVASYQETLDTAKEALETAEEQLLAVTALADGVVTAEYAGEVSGVFYEVGDTVSSMIPLATFSSTDTLIIETEVSQEDISKIAVGDEVEIMLNGVRGENPTGTISYIASSATTGRSMSNVTYTVKVSMDNSEGIYSANTSAYVYFNYGTLEDVEYVLSDVIIQSDGTQGKIKRYNANGEIEEVTVTIGETTERYTVITEGLEEGDICLIDIEGAMKNE